MHFDYDIVTRRGGGVWGMIMNDIERGSGCPKLPKSVDNAIFTQPLIATVICPVLIIKLLITMKIYPISIYNRLKKKSDS